jgi:hypothetical protein
MRRYFPISNVMKLNLAIMELICAYRSMGRTDGRSDCNRLSAGIRARLGKKKITFLVGQENKSSELIKIIDFLRISCAYHYTG